VCTGGSIEKKAIGTEVEQTKINLGVCLFHEIKSKRKVNANLVIFMYAIKPLSGVGEV
jgi:hypothetical protein